MGAVLERKDRIDKFKRSSASNFIAEVFFDELQFILEEDLRNRVIVLCHGMNARVQSKDILNVSIRGLSDDEAYVECVVLHLARNGIYHQLPELLFHPLVLSSAGMSKREIVEAIRTNKRKERRQLAFFVPFDTELFKEHIKINNRQLNFFADLAQSRNLEYIIDSILGLELPLSKHEKYKLFLMLCQAEHYKEDLPQIEQLLFIVLGVEVRLSYQTDTISQSVFAAVGEGQLGYTLGLCGQTKSEIDDLDVTIYLDEQIDDHKKLSMQMEMIRSILYYFILSVRTIHIMYTTRTNTEFILNRNRLGYDTHL